MKIHKGITLKLFVLMLLFFGTFISVLIYVQLFVVGRLYLTTEYTKQREEALYPELTDLAHKYSMIFDKEPFIMFDIPTGNRVMIKTDYAGSMLSEMNIFERANRAYVVVLDADYKIKLITQNGKAVLGGHYLRSIINTLKKDLVQGNRRLSFRVKGIFNIPSKYISVSIPLYSNDSNQGGYIVAVTPEVYTNQNVNILKKYVIYIFIAAVLLTIIIAGILSYIITRPILKINRTASRMIEMNFTEKCDVKSKDEIGNLASSLNFLSDKLDTTLNQLQNANEKLQRDLDIQRELDLMRKDFIAAVSHEFKTPVTLLRGYTESIKDKVAQEHERDMVLNTIITEVNKIDKLVQNLLDLSSMETSGYKMEWSEFYIEELLKNISKKYELLMKDKRLNFRTDISCNDILVKADSFRIEQVVSNFLNNAIANTEEGKTIILMCKREGDSVNISVENEGNHIPDEERNRIWEKFYRVDKSRSRKTGGGTGLGLAICKTILDNHACTYGVENTELGVKFYFSIKMIF